MSKCRKVYFVLAVSLLLVYGFSLVVARFVYPYPPMAVTIPCMYSLYGLTLFRSDQPVLLLSGAIAVGAVCHIGLFLLLNLYILRRATRQIALQPSRAFLPSNVAVVLILALSILYWFLAGRDGLRIQGFGYLLLYGALNVVTLSGLIAARWLIVKRLSIRASQRSERAVLCYNFAIHAALLLVLFPFMGETL